MVDDMIFCKSFAFNNFHFMNYKYTDKTEGIQIHYLAYMTRGNARICTKEETVYIKNTLKPLLKKQEELQLHGGMTPVLLLLRLQA